MIRSRVAAVAAAILVVAVVSFAQEDEVRQVEKRFQQGYPYEVGETVDPAVEIDGLRWSGIRVEPRGDREIVADEEIPVFVHLEFENRTEDALRAQVIVLFEGEDGRPLHRMRCDDVKVGGGRFEEDRQKHKVPGSALLGMVRLYVFCEVE